MKSEITISLKYSFLLYFLCLSGLYIRNPLNDMKSGMLFDSFSFVFVRRSHCLKQVLQNDKMSWQFPQINTPK